MLTKTFHSIQSMFERPPPAQHVQRKVDKGSSRSYGCIRMWFYLAAPRSTRSGLDPAFRKAHGRGQRCRHGSDYQHRYLLYTDSDQDCLRLNLI